MPTTILIVEDEFLIAVEMEAVVHDLGHESAGIADDMQFGIGKGFRRDRCGARRC